MEHALKSNWAQWNSLVLEEVVLKRVLESDDGSAQKMQIVIPRSKVLKALCYLHDGSSGGHLKRELIARRKSDSSAAIMRRARPIINQKKPHNTMEEI